MFPSPHCFLAGRWWSLRGKKCYWPLEGWTHHCATLKKDFMGVSWDFTKWLGYVAHEECVWSTVDTSFQLSFSFCGDCFPCCRGSRIVLLC